MSKQTKPNLLAKPILFNGCQVVLACDGRCDLAWGVEKRPRSLLSASDPDDYLYASDEQVKFESLPPPRKLDSEGGDLKPSNKPLANLNKMNRWCARQCERSCIMKPVLPDLANPKPNKDQRYKTLNARLDLEFEWGGAQYIRICHCFEYESILYFGTLIQLTEKQLRSIPNFGSKCLRSVKEEVERRGFSLNSSIPSAVGWIAPTTKITINNHYLEISETSMTRSDILSEAKKIEEIAKLRPAADSEISYARTLLTGKRTLLMGNGERGEVGPNQFNSVSLTPGMRFMIHFPITSPFDCPKENSR